MHVASVVMNSPITTEWPVSYRLRNTTYQKESEFVSLLIYIRNRKSVIALLSVKQSLVVIAYSYQVFAFSTFLQDPLHFRFWYVFPNGTYIATLTGGSTDKYNINNCYSIYILFNNKKRLYS